jgi:hypothetical protein
VIGTCNTCRNHERSRRHHPTFKGYSREKKISKVIYGMDRIVDVCMPNDAQTEGGRRG